MIDDATCCKCKQVINSSNTSSMASKLKSALRMCGRCYLVKKARERKEAKKS